MSSISSHRVQQAISTLRQMHQAVLQPFVERRTAYQPNTLYSYAFEELEDAGIPDRQWEWSSLNITLYGLMALPNRADFADLILHILELCGHEPYMLPIAAFNDYLMPDDQWASAFLIKQILPVITAGNPPSPAAMNEQQQMQQVQAAAAIPPLGVVGDAAAVEVLTAALRYPNRCFAVNAAQALGELRAATAEQPLMELVRQQREPAAITALGQLRTAASGTFLRDLLIEYQAEQAIYFGDYTKVVCALLPAVAQQGDQAAIPALAWFLDVPDREVNLAAAKALSRLGDRRGLALIRKAMNTRYMRRDAARHMLGMGDPEGLSTLIDWYWRDPDGYSTRTERSQSDQQHFLHLLRRADEPGDQRFLEWVAANDFRQTGQGWSFAEEARRALAHIQARRQRFAGA